MLASAELAALLCILPEATHVAAVIRQLHGAGWSKPASLSRRVLKNGWSKEQVPVGSFIIRGLTVILPSLSPYTKLASTINQTTTHNNPVPIPDDGNMPNLPNHPEDPQDPSLEWLKNL
ncbi:NADH dehydrogenase [ubiquinone] 1 alpha subcomplex subunit 3-like [Choloepus didactylus]|uniref:NADH dehydrogenase [ubiquinone] 1 alpha subcomplex subunit 3-like n=1 Tax=Choloepus didactylus TaxID=27675 RepID=UPI00189E45DE|nr:NADH dehydrogenase [ubiquinone] 1 alpha subcomplex subunit 3-like [Choloepus didactylus]